MKGGLGILLLGWLMGCRITSAPMERRPFHDGSSGKGPSLLVLGDSISTGVLAVTQLGHTPAPRYSSEFPRWLFGGISRASLHDHFSDMTRSFAATDQLWGLRAAIARKASLPDATHIPVQIQAQFGWKIGDIQQALKKNMASPPQYISLLAGANNFCEGRDPSKFQATYEAVLNQLHNLYPNATVLVGYLPNILSLKAHEHTYSLVLSCKKFQRAFCPALFQPGTSQAFLAFNQAIETAVAKTHIQYPDFVVRTADHLRELPLPEENVAFDCFHPSEAGQRAFATTFVEALP